MDRRRIVQPTGVFVQPGSEQSLAGLADDKRQDERPGVDQCVKISP